MELAATAYYMYYNLYKLATVMWCNKGKPPK